MGSHAPREGGEHMKKIAESGVMALIRKRWPHLQDIEVIEDGSKYGAPNDEDYTRHPIMKVVKVKDIKALERKGGIVYRNGAWYVGRETVPTMINAKPHYGVNRHYLEYARRGRMTEEQRVNDDARKASLEDPITRMSGTEN